MYLLQALIFCAVVGSNIHWQWTPNPYLASGIGVFLAWIVTTAIVEFRDRRAASKNILKHQITNRIGDDCDN